MHDASRSLVDECGQCGAGHAHGRVQVQLERRVPLGVGDVEEPDPGFEGARVVDEAVQAAVPFQRDVHDVLGGVGPGEVGGHVDGERATPTTWAPSRARRAAVASPIPADAPVTM